MARRDHRHLSEDEIKRVLSDIRSLNRRGQPQLAIALFNQHFPNDYEQQIRPGSTGRLRGSRGG